MRVHAFAATARGARLEPFDYDAPALGPHDIRIHVDACGICRSDVHMIDDDWRLSRYPLVPGHEVVGIVEEVGALAAHAKGDLVGVGWQRGACLVCGDCLRGDENLCARAKSTIGDGHGGFADRLVVDGRFAFRVPEAIPSDVAGPLLCGGATVYSALRRAGLRGGQEVGVIGLGGLGHMAVQFAARLGNRVTVFTSTADKARGAGRLGASEVVVTGSKPPKTLTRPLDVLISTAPAALDWNAYVKLLGTYGTLTFVASEGSPIAVPPDLLMFGRKRITGSIIGGRHEIAEMLEVAARFGVTPQVEIFPMQEANAALERVRRNAVRHRAVLRAA
jgi:alcohol/geraniol dehydrogenase (NADP+)